MTMRNATLRQLKVFETVARHLSFSRAAEELHLTQPAVSTQVRQLEEHAGLPLFEQLGKKIYLTPAGTEMLHYSRAIIQQFHEVDEAMSQLKGVSGGKLNVAVISAGDYFFPRLLAEFTRRYSGVVLNLAVHNREELLHQLVDESDRSRGDGAPAARNRRDQRTLRAAPLCDRGGAHPSARSQAQHQDESTRERGFYRARARLGHVEFDGRRLCRASRQSEDRDGDQRAPRRSSRR